MRLYQKTCVACGTAYEVTGRRRSQRACGSKCASRLRAEGTRAAAARKRVGVEPAPERGVRFVALTRGEFAKVDKVDFDDVCRWNWRLWEDRAGRKYAAQGYWTRRGKGKRTFTMVFLHRYLVGAGPGEAVDHMNGDGLDNRRCNLRKASSVENNRNRKKGSNTASRYKGVARHYDKWAAAIWLFRKKLWLGRFETEEAAARAYDESARRLHGEFARVNFPREGEQPALH